MNPHAPPVTPGRWDFRAVPALGSLGLVTAAVLAGGLADSVVTAGFESTAASGGPGAARPIPAEFLAHAVAAQCGLLVVMAAVLVFRPPNARFAGAQGRNARATLAAIAAALGLNAAGSWLIGWTGETYLGMPEVRGDGWSVLILVVAGISAPWIEELFFRETILVRVLEPVPRGWALALSSLAFGALHLPAGGPVLFATMTAMGAVFGWLRLRSGTVAPAVAAHAVNNLLALALAWSTGS